MLSQQLSSLVNPPAPSASGSDCEAGIPVDLVAPDYGASACKLYIADGRNYV